MLKIKPQFRRLILNPLILAIPLLVSSSASAFEASLDVNPELIRIGESTRLKLTIKNLRRPPAPLSPNVEGLKIGDFSGRQSNINIINGKRSSSVSYICSIQPLKTGTFTIPLTYVANGEKHNLSTTLKVIGTKEEGATEHLDELIFARLDSPTTNLFIQEKVRIKLSVFTQQEIPAKGIQKPQGLPESGFSKFEWQALPGIKQREISGRIYNLKEYVAETRALTAGLFEIAPQVPLQIEVPDKRRRGGIFDSFFNRAQTRTVSLEPKPLSLKVNPLPEAGRPNNFSGGIGEFTFNVDIGPLELTAGDPVTVKIYIGGNGNLSQISAPAYPETKNLKTYQPSVGEEKNGQIFVEQVLIPTDASLKELPEISLNYFDPQAKRYKRITRGPFPLKIEPGSQESARIFTNQSARSRSKLEIIGKDIIYLKDRPKSWERHRKGALPGRELLVWLIILPAIFASCAFLLGRRRHRLLNDEVAGRRHKAPRIAKRELQRAKKELKAGHPNEFYSALWKALTEYFANRLNLEPGDLSETAVLERMRRANLEEETMEKTQRLFRTCERARFGQAGSEQTERLEELHQLLAALIKSCERKNL